uniref:Uncharacterized protein n=1 Tax=Glossina pallidipes TaxID=7398 RepID=A0A1B0AJW7_GLOPL
MFLAKSMQKLVHELNTYRPLAYMILHYKIEWPSTHAISRSHIFQITFLHDLTELAGFALRHVNTLESEEQQEGHHKTEQTHSFRKGETQDSIGEQLLFQRWISSVTNDKGTKYCSDTGTCLYWKDLHANSHKSILIHSQKDK